MSIANFNIVGNLCRDAELRVTPANYPIATFTVAVNNRRRNKEGVYEEQASFFKCKLLGTRAEALAPFLTKGKKVAVSGNVSQNRWTDKDGNAKSSWEFLANDIEFMSQPVKSEGQEKPYKPDYADEDIPF